jgi:hypothetical protein
MRLWMRRNGLNPQGSFFLYPRTAGTSGRMWIGRSSKIARTAEVGACLKSPVWFRLGRLRKKCLFRASTTPALSSAISTDGQEIGAAEEHGVVAE